MLHELLRKLTYLSDQWKPCQLHVEGVKPVQGIAQLQGLAVIGLQFGRLVIKMIGSLILAISYSLCFVPLAQLSGKRILKYLPTPSAWPQLL